MLRDDSETSNTVAISPEGAATDVHSSTNQRRAFLPMGSSRNGFCSEGMANVARSVDDNVSAAVPIVKMRYRSSPTEGSKAADRNSFFDLLAAHRTADALRDQRSPGPPLGRQYFSPGELADEDSSQHSSPGSTGNSRQSPLHWLVKMGVAEHDGNLPISIRRPKKEERAVSPPIKRVKQQPSTFLKRLRSGSSEMSLDKTETERLKKRAFAHYDTQSMASSLTKSPVNSPADINKNTGASAISQQWDEIDDEEQASNDLLASCPFFRNEISQSHKPDVRSNGMFSVKVGSTQRRRVSRAADTVMESKRRRDSDVSDHQGGDKNSWLFRENLRGNESRDPEREMFEFVDYGALYYRKFFYNLDHQNYLGVDENLGAVAISLRREVMESSVGKERYLYRIIARTSHLVALRGSIPEDSIPASCKPTSRGLPAKDVLDFVAGSELQLSCLRLAQTGNKVPEQLLRLDEEGLSLKYRIGVIYCKEGQSTEDEMYGNEEGSPAFDYFLSQLGDKVILRGFAGYRAQLDTKTDSTGTHSVYTSFHGCEIMFHVSTLLPYMPNKQQQVLRKRHIGNDIVTIIFQEPGAKSFSPKVIRSQFQHVFIIVRVHNPEAEKPQYSVAVSRSMHVPSFGPELPPYGYFDPGKGFREFLLTKAINSENAARRSARFAAMAMRTRKEYLEDLARNYTTSQTLDSAFGLYGKLFPRSLGQKRKEKLKPYLSLETAVRGAITWNVEADDFGTCPEERNISCVFGVSVDNVVLVDESTKETVFSIPSKTIIGWTSKDDSLKVYYNTGEFIMLRLPRGADLYDIQEMVKRLSAVSSGCETQEMTLRRNATGQLGFSIQPRGLVGDVDPYRFAYQAGVRPGARVVEIGDIPVCFLDHEQTVELLRVAGSVKVMVIPPLLDGQSRGALLQRPLSWSSLLPQITSEPMKHEAETLEAKAVLRKRMCVLERPNSADRLLEKRKLESRNRTAGSLPDLSTETRWYESSSDEAVMSEEDKSSLGQLSYVSSEAHDNDPTSTQHFPLDSSQGNIPSHLRQTSPLAVDDVEVNMTSNNVSGHETDDEEEVAKMDTEETKEDEEMEEYSSPVVVEVQRLPVQSQSQPQLSLVSISTLAKPRVATIADLSCPVMPESRLSPSVMRKESVERVSSDEGSPFVERRRKEDERPSDEMVQLVSQAMTKIGDLEKQVQQLSSQLRSVSIENERLNKQLVSEKKENESLRVEARRAASELRDFTDWFYQQQFHLVVQEDF
ncbi:signal-induced proliferation-associated 1-like protein 1 [Corticium candelabrum]|uniref:signal-induced proliferation-associated 1-like protein 1 n=1 Tax=Corticium candelabrum TaxID=121492 RepID=UPI002E26465C|nr:signal-induced proliferation-associated 1-like protein 1 [Corticium candelabrum]